MFGNTHVEDPEDLARADATTCTWGRPMWPRPARAPVPTTKARAPYAYACQYGRTRPSVCLRPQEVGPTPVEYVLPLGVTK